MPARGGKKPDYLIVGKAWDCKAPSGNRARNSASEIEIAAETGQAERFVLNLEDSGISVSDMKKQLNDWPIEGLKEVIAIKNGQLFPKF
ncbi:MAG: hypothetical protein HRU19_12990 [Pseudobacteriovorax sp.]|nr:hypothetical protein [Pseudobacteriovorax sp.]